MIYNTYSPDHHYFMPLSYFSHKSLVIVFFTIFFQAQTAKALDVATPVKYTAMLMTVEFAALHALDLAEDSMSFENFGDTLKDPVPEEDDDNDFINYVLHPLMGSETYLRARESEFGVPGSIAFSMAASITWEYLVESWTEHPSTQDLFFTTGVGWLIGEARYHIKKSNARNGRSNFWVDPIWTTLEYLDIGITKNRGEALPTVSLKFTL